jgi:hypothetical protein
MPRFVILEHDHPMLHWDFMLEIGGALRTWRLASAPIKMGNPIEATPLGDHRLAYLDYEGPVSGGRGQVRRWDRGEFDLLSAVEGESIRIELRGEKVRGVVAIKDSGAGWLFQTTL